MVAASAIPEFAETVRRPVLAVRNSSLYESGSTARRLARWHAPTTYPNSNLSQLPTLRDRSRATYRNDGYYIGAIEEIVSNIVGTGIMPLSKAVDAELRRAMQTTFAAWTNQADATGGTDFYGLQTLAARTWHLSGECFIRLRSRLATDGLIVPLQIELLEPEMCPYSHTATLANGNRVRAGIEFNGIGQRVAYYFHPSRPGAEDDFDAGTLRRVPASGVIHLYNPLRPGQLRGEPTMSHVLLRLHEIGKLDDALVLRHQIANMFAGFIKRDAQTGDESTNPFTGETVEAGGTEPPIVSLEPGLLQELNPGEEIEFSEPPDVSSNYADFMRLQLASAAAGTGIPYEFFSGDMSKVNDRSLRVIVQRFRRRIQAWQHQVVGFQFCQRVWSEWLFHAFLSGALDMPTSYLVNREPIERVRWMPQAWPYINPVQDVAADKAEIRAGLASRSAKVAERGDDVEQIDQEQADDNARAAELGLVHDSNAKHTSDAGVTQARPAGSELPEETA